MTDDECNRIIAEYMGWKYYHTHDPSPVFVKNGIEYNERDIFNKYTKSLDALIPVWEKLKNKKIIIDNMIPLDGTIFVDLDSYSIVSDEWESIQQAAAHATAMAIQEITKGEDI